MFAVIESGGKQYRVSQGSVIDVERLDGPIGQQLDIQRVMLVSDAGSVRVGSPFIEGSTVQATILDQSRAPKIRVFKMKRRKRYRRQMGHRQHFTRLRIDNILVSGDAR